MTYPAPSLPVLNADRQIWSEHSQEAANCCSTFGFLLTLHEARPLLSQAECEAFGRAVLRFTHLLTQDLLLDPSTAAEILRAFIREWHLRNFAEETE
jgi:hypothetical protein